MVKILNKEEIGKKIKSEREALNNSLDQFALKVNISRQTLSRWEKGEGAGPTVIDLLKMCDAFDCDFGYIVGEYENKKRVNTDIGAETGLSDPAINVLKQLREEDTEKCRVLSAIIESPFFIDMLTYISQAEKLSMPIDYGAAQDAYNKVWYQSIEDCCTSGGPETLNLDPKRMAKEIPPQNVATLNEDADAVAELAPDRITLNNKDAAKFYLQEAEVALRQIADRIVEKVSEHGECSKN